MTEFETRLSEFREDFRKAAMNGFIPYEVNYGCSDGYRASIIFKIECDGFTMNVPISVADTFVCIHEPLLDGVFKREDIQVLHELIDKVEVTSGVKEKQLRVKKLMDEVYKLEKEIHDGTKVSVAS